MLLSSFQGFVQATKNVRTANLLVSSEFFNPCIMKSSIHTYITVLLMVFAMIFVCKKCATESSSSESTFDSIECTDNSLLKSLPKEILDCILSLTDKKGRISMSVACKLFEGYKLPHLSSSFGFLYHNWIGKYRNQLKLCVCPGNEKLKIKEFVLASKSEVVSEIQFSSFIYFYRALEFGFIPKINQKISFAFTTVLFDYKLLSNSALRETIQEMNLMNLSIDTISITSSDKIDIHYFKIFLQCFEAPNLSISKLKLTLNRCKAISFKEVLSLLSNCSISNLWINYESYDVWRSDVVQILKRNAKNLRELNVFYCSWNPYADHSAGFLRHLFPILPLFENLEVFNTNLPAAIKFR